jgi:hypothetical protein
MKVSLLRRIFFTASALAGLAGAPAEALAGTATDVSGLYYTGLNSSGGLQNGGSTDANWAVTYARVGGSNYSGNSTYTGTSYVLSGSYIDAAYVPNSSSSQWITAPGARTAATGGTANVGGDYLPGNGTSGTNTAIYNYTTSFTISGTGYNVNNKVSISLTIAADDQYAIYVNPVLNSNGSVNTSSSTASAVGYSAWNNTTTVYLQNFSNSNGSDNADFVIGTNKIVIVVTNTNSINGSSSSTVLNPSGLLVYQVGSLATIDGKPVPEVGAWLPVAGALGLFGVMAWRRRRERIQPVQA